MGLIGKIGENMSFRRFVRKTGKVVAALSVAFPLERYSDAAAASARQALDEARRQIERMLCSVELQF